MTVAPPPDATEVEPWLTDDDGLPFRHFSGFIEQAGGGITVEVYGEQTLRSVKRAVYICKPEQDPVELKTIEEVDALIDALSKMVHRLKVETL